MHSKAYICSAVEHVGESKLKFYLVNALVDVAKYCAILLDLMTQCVLNG